MGRLGQSKVMKRRGAQLELRVHKACKPLFHTYCQKPGDETNTIPITFLKHTMKQYLHSSTLSVIGEELVSTGHNTIHVDPRVFFEPNHELDSFLTISESVLEPMNVKANIVHDKISRLVLHCGQRMNRKKNFKGMVVIMTFIKTFVGDRVSVHEALMELDRQREKFIRQQGFNVVPVTLSA